MSVNCIKCDGGTRVVSSRLPHRRRVCKGCGYRFNTTEVSDEARVFVPEPLVSSNEELLRQIITILHGGPDTKTLHEAGIDEQGSDDEQ
mgnify:CR=1 FL=1